MAALATPGATVGVQPGGPYEIKSAPPALRLGTPGGMVNVNLRPEAATPPPAEAARNVLWTGMWGAR
ncbi:MAG: hypothetical protein ACOZAP_04560 [Pseudomonadota bacterium]